MPLWKVASAPEDLDASADAIVDEPPMETLIPLFPTRSDRLVSRASRPPQSLLSGPPAADKQSTPGGANPQGDASISKGSLGGNKGVPFLMEAEMPVDMNKNTNWFSYPGVWSMYFIIVLLTWLFVLATAGCSPSTAWIITNCTHFLVTFYLFHWKKGSPFPAEDQGHYDNLTWWEQMDSGRQLTRNRKFLTLVPVILFVIASVASRSSPHSSALLFVNTCIVFTLVIAKLPALHKIRILGING